MLDTKTIEEKHNEHLECLKKESHEKLMALAELDINADVNEALAKIFKYGNCEDKACMLKLYVQLAHAEHELSMPK